MALDTPDSFLLYKKIKLVQHIQHIHTPAPPPTDSVSLQRGGSESSHNTTCILAVTNNTRTVQFVSWLQKNPQKLQLKNDELISETKELICGRITFVFTVPFQQH